MIGLERGYDNNLINILLKNIIYQPKIITIQSSSLSYLIRSVKKKNCLLLFFYLEHKYYVMKISGNYCILYGYEFKCSTRYAAIVYNTSSYDQLTMNLCNSLSCKEKYAFVVAKDRLPNKRITNYTIPRRI